jgi:hypothetical protein
MKALFANKAKAIAGMTCRFLANQHPVNDK